MSRWYRTGTANFTSGSTAVSGTGTNWLSLTGNAQVANAMRGADGRFYEIDQVTAPGALTLAEPYEGPTVTGASYAIVPTMGLTADLAAKASEVIVTNSESIAAARDVALAAGNLYPDEATGRAAVQDGKTFNVQGAGDVAAFQYRRVNADSSTLIATYPSAGALTAAQSAMTSAQESLDTANEAIQEMLDTVQAPIVEISTNLIATQAIVAGLVAFS